MSTGLIIIFTSIGITTVIAVIFWIYKLYSRRSKDLEERNKRLTALRKMDEVMMSSTTNLVEVAQKVTDAISFELGFEIGVLALIDETNQVLRRVAMSNTPTGIQAKKALPIRYENLSIPLTFDTNLSIKAIKEGKVQITHNLHDVFVPTLDAQMSARIQQICGLKTSMIYPLRARGKTLGVMIVSIGRLESQMSNYERESIENLIDFVGISLDNAILYQSLEETTTKLQQANIRLKQLDKLKDDFVSMASHELRVPMTAIRSYVWMALNKSDMALSEKMKKYLTRTLVSTERLINLVNDMLNISRIDSGRIEVNPKIIDLIALSSEVVDEVSPKASERGIQILVAKDKVPPVFADDDKVHQILLNLVGNALKFTPSGGKIMISFFTDGNMIDVSIKDSGTGISKEDLGSLFQKFGRLDSSYVAMGTSGGTGLGLYICKSLVEVMHGRIWASSEGLNKGTTFTFSLPVASSQVLAHADQFKIKPKDGVEAKPLESATI